jgi:hypothetical protein
LEKLAVSEDRTGGHPSREVESGSEVVLGETHSKDDDGVGMDGTGKGVGLGRVVHVFHSGCSHAPSISLMSSCSVDVMLVPQSLKGAT